MHAEIFQAGIDVSLYEFAHGNHDGDLCKTTCPNTRVLQVCLQVMALFSCRTFLHQQASSSSFNQ
ncbi:hypothetical protein CsSME_00027540 [Camellia sinensis var. sinensis]